MSPALPSYRWPSLSIAARNEKGSQKNKNSAADTKIQSLTPLPPLWEAWPLSTFYHEAKSSLLALRLMSSPTPVLHTVRLPAGMPVRLHGKRVIPW